MSLSFDRFQFHIVDCVDWETWWSTLVTWKDRDFLYLWCKDAWRTWDSKLWLRFYVFWHLYSKLAAVLCTFCWLSWMILAGVMWDFMAQKSTPQTWTSWRRKESFWIITMYNRFVLQREVRFSPGDIQYTQVCFQTFFSTLCIFHNLSSGCMALKNILPKDYWIMLNFQVKISIDMHYNLDRLLCMCALWLVENQCFFRVYDIDRSLCALWLVKKPMFYQNCNIDRSLCALWLVKNPIIFQSIKHRKSLFNIIVFRYIISISESKWRSLRHVFTLW